MQHDDASSERASHAELAAAVAAMRAENAALAAERDQYKDLATFLQRELDRLRDRQKTPREFVDPDQIQLAFDALSEQLLAKIPPNDRPGSPHDRKRPERKITPHGRSLLPEHLAVKTLLIAPSVIPPGAVRIGEEVTWRLGFQPAEYYRLKLVRPVLVVPTTDAAVADDARVSLHEGDVLDAPQPPSAMPTECSTNGAIADTSKCATLFERVKRGELSIAETTVVICSSLDEMIPRGLPTPDLLARVFTGKFADKLPFNRQEALFARAGVRISRATMCGWAERCHDLARLVVEAMIDDAREHAHYISTDATGVLVQANEKCRNGHFWVLVAERDHVVFRYSKRHSSEEPKKFLKGFRGIVVADASNVFDALFGLADGPTESGCFSHARRYFYKAIASDRERALIGVGFANKLFEIEREIAKLPPDKRLAIRQQRAGPIVDALREWRDQMLARSDVHEGTPLRRALGYLRNHWDALTRFLHDGKIPIHNNRSELELRRLVVGRANWLFVGSDDSAEWTCTFVSLVASCEINGLDPQAYLRDLFRVLPMWPKNRLLELAPKYWRATRDRLDLAELEMPLGPITIPPHVVVRQEQADQVESVHAK
jgi:hypothetical protein